MPYLKLMTSKGLLYSTGNSAQCYVANWMRGEFGGEWMHVICMAKSLCRLCETNSIVNQVYSSIK